MTRNSGVPPTPTIAETLDALNENAQEIKNNFPPHPEHATLDWIERAEELLHHQKVYIERLGNFLHPHLEELILYRLQVEELKEKTKELFRQEFEERHPGQKSPL